MSNDKAFKVKNGLELAGYDTRKAVTAVDVFVYDTSKDSDGGAWRKRTQGTSWYNETLNTATRGARREFPSVAVIVAETNKVTIYDGDDPSLPMWMVFINDHRKKGIPVVLVGGAGITVGGLAALNGTICWSNASVSYGGLIEARFASDSGNITTGAGWNSSFDCKANIAQRNTTDETNGSTSVAGPLVNKAVKDVAMTVLPNAPIDAATGLPVPTIAVATAGGVSVIKDDGTVNDSASTINTVFLSFSDEGLWYGYDTSFSFATNADFLAGDGFGDITASTGGNRALDLKIRWRKEMFTFGNTLVGGGGLVPRQGFEQFSLDYDDFPNSMKSETTSTFNTGWQQGDIKGAFLSDTDDTDVVGGVNLVSSTFIDSEWTQTEDGWTISSGVASCDGIDGSEHLYVQGSVTGLTDYEQIAVTFTISNYTSGTLRVSFTNGSPTPDTFTANGTYTVVGSLTTNESFYFKSENFNGSLESPIIKRVEPDRSVNGKGLQVFGTVTKTPVATGADLVAYSGFSGSNYLDQPYNSDLDFGTGDFCVMGWANGGGTGTIIERVADDGGDTGYQLVNTGSAFSFSVKDGGSTKNVTSPQPDDWAFVCAVREGDVIRTYTNGVLGGTTTGVAAYDVSLTATPLSVGIRQYYSTYAQTGSIALLRISATAPSAAQIAKIYNDEKVLFQENAQATLYGTSDAVTALAHDDDTNLLHVGTSAGRSVFQGLRRVSNTTTAVGTAISASNSLVVEE